MVTYVCVLFLGGCRSLIGLLVVMSVVVVLVLLFFSFPADGVAVGRAVPVRLFFVVCHCFRFGSVASRFISFFV